MTYFISDDGALYGGFDNYFCIIGGNINDAMLHLFFEHENKNLCQVNLIR